MTEEENELVNKMRELVTIFTKDGYDVVATGPYKACLWKRRVGLLRKMKGLMVELEAQHWNKLSDYFDKGNFTLGNIFGFSKGEQKFFMVLAVDDKKRVAIIYTAYIHNEVYEEVKRCRPLLVIFKNKSNNKMFASFVNDFSWSRKLEAQQFPKEIFLVRKTLFKEKTSEK
ncbi:MAG: hypothetical protein NZ932_06425 [Candidatus Bathyarchaeota archaeon]|nr:hypothetical protein [Candidatus Bathyarchaeota archaeon]MDW8040359.1 hypothetical protein [Nitrososphaerota archaeon]